MFRRRYLIALLYLMVTTAGVVAWQNVPMELAPDISLPSVSVSYQWGSTSPEVMEQEVTRKVEQAAYRLRDVEKVRSITREGRSSVNIEFAKHAPVDFRIIELQEALFALRDQLPESLGNHRISRRVPQELSDMQAFITYSISGPYSSSELLEFARQNVRNPLLGHRGLADIEILGARDPALSVRFDSRITDRFDIRTPEIMRQIRDQLSWRSAGFTEVASDRFSMMVPPASQSLEDLYGMTVPLPGSARGLQLRDIATIRVEDYPARQLRRINGSTALSISFVKEGGADALGLAAQIHEDMQAVQHLLRPGMELRLELDVTEELREQLDELQMQALVSLLGVFLVLLLFIRRFRAPFVILGSIIFSLMISLFALWLLGFTINILTLAGLTVALGMVIDNAIVVFEQVNPGLPVSREARLAHVRRELRFAVVPVLGSTLTTVGIFIPLFFTLESLQMFLVPLAVALSFTLMASVFISLSWIPYALIWLTPAREGRTSNVKNGRHEFSKRLNQRLNRFMMRFFALRYRLRWPLYIGVTFLIGIPLFLIEEPERASGGEEAQPALWEQAASYYFDKREAIDPWIGGLSYRFATQASFNPPWGRSFGETITVSVDPPQGSPLEEIDKIIRNFETLGDTYSEALLYYETDVSEYSGARLRFHIDPDYLFDPLPYMLYGEAAYLAARTGNVRTSVSGLGDAFSSGYGGSSASFRVRFRGYSYDDLYTTARDLERRLSESRRVDNVDINTVGWGRSDYQQYQLRLDEARLFAKGLNRRALLETIQMDLNPTNTFGQIEFQGQNMFLIGINQPAGIYLEDFTQAPRSFGETGFTIDEVAEIVREPAMGQIRREDQSYIRTVSFDFLGPQRLGRRYLDTVLETLPLPVGTQIEDQRGFSFQREEDRQATWMMLALALLSVWMIVSALLERWRDPLIVIMAVPLSLIGIMAGVLYTGIVFDQGAIAGSLLAVGVVVNNGILLMHERERLNLAGVQGLRSWVKVYRRKMRPVLITTLTTIGGLLPLIFLGSSDFWSDLATVVVWGLSFSTLGILALAGVWEESSEF